MRVAAYLLLGDPRWMRESVLSYYGHVDRIIAIGDIHQRAWDGTPLPVRDCIDILQGLDDLGKVEVVLRPLVHHGVNRMVLDTDARSSALALLPNFDWVVQLDSDEILTAPATFFGMLQKADDVGAEALDYPSRWMLGRASLPFTRDIYLEASDSLGRVSAHYPGPLAVRPRVRLSYSRRAFANYYRVDFRWRNTYHEYTASHPVHAVIPKRDAVLHMSWVDKDGEAAKSAEQHGHRNDHNLESFDALRRDRLRHPLRTVLTNPLRANHGHPHRLRLTRLDINATAPRFAGSLIDRVAVLFEGDAP